MIGLIWTRVPRTAVVFDIRPPLWEMIQIIHSDVMADMKFVLLRPGCDLIDRLSLLFQLESFIEKKAFSQAGTEVCR